MKDLNFTRAEVVAHARFKKDAISIVALQKACIHNLIQVIKGRLIEDQDL
jgi:hypothetical protein